MGKEIVTLEDLLRPELRVVCVGINPPRVSVEAGHYYQGPVGQRILARLRAAGVIPPAPKGSEDDAAFAAGVGFTDIVKRPTASADDLRPADFAHGRGLLVAKVEKVRPALVIFTYKKAAKAIFRSFEGNGFVEGLRLADADVFVMPGPYESAATASATMGQLRGRILGFGRFDRLYEPGYLDALRAGERA